MYAILPKLERPLGKSVAIAVLSLLVTACEFGDTAADKSIDYAVSRGEIATPDTVNSKSWVFWCRTGWPDGRSGSTHFEEAARYAKKFSLNYSGPSGIINEDQKWALVFVFADGSFEVAELTEYRFPSKMEGFCARKAEVVFHIDGKLIVEGKLK
jgi:hypothetical protein